MMPTLKAAWGKITGRTAAQAAIRAKFQAAISQIKARYDAAQSTDENTRHWSNADDLSARSANNWSVRNTLRRRARYEFANNSWLKGMVHTYANEVVGTGPRRQIQTGNPKVDRIVEHRWMEWTRATDLAAKLRLVASTRLVDGEIFGIKAKNPELDCPVQFDLKLVEADQCTTPNPAYMDHTAVDGIRFDAWGNPTEYDILPYHPGGSGEFGYTPHLLQPIAHPASQILHWFRLERAGQARGIPDVTPSLPLFAQLRRYTRAVLMAAEIAASFAAVIKTTYPGSSDDPPGVDAFELADIVHGMFQMLPYGTEMQQFRAEQPVTGYGEFVDRILKEASRSLEMPYGTATGDSSAYNYSSGRLDVQAWQRKVNIERAWHERQLNRVFMAWADEAQRIEGYLPIRDVAPPSLWRMSWNWDGFKHVDPSKESRAQADELTQLATNLTTIMSEKGIDLVEHLDTLAAEVEMCKSRGLTHPSEMKQPPSLGDAFGMGGSIGDAKKGDEEGAENENAEAVA